MKVFLDDARPTPEGWLRTYTVKETIDLLLTGDVTHLSLDNDLGFSDYKTEGYNVLDWLEEHIEYNPNFPIPEITIHSANTTRRQSMQMVADRLLRKKLWK